MRREWISLTKPKWEPNRDAGSFNFIHNMKGWRKGTGRGRGGGLRGAGDPPHLMASRRLWPARSPAVPSLKTSSFQKEGRSKRVTFHCGSYYAISAMPNPLCCLGKLDFSGNLSISPLSKWVMFRCTQTLFQISRGVVVAAEGFSPSAPFFRGRGQYDFRRRGLLHASPGGRQGQVRCSPGGRQGQVRCAWKVFVFCGYWTSCSSCVN
uniref:Uncharacterized protein n=1 Tax=Rousettus aegyptiacus TaxID=9407 RepID=A0A7J8C259_ROUAE|nr:hypothetical protein HJG63_009275 [Rousettus aegyptiacus]